MNYIHNSSGKLMAKRISIKIFPDGKVQAEVEGIKGKTCTDYIKIIEEILEAEIIDSDYTPDYFKSENLNLESENNEIIRRID